MGIGYSTDVGLAFDVPASRWFNSFSSISKASSAATDPGERPLATISFGTNVPDGVYADLCGRVRRDPIGRSTETDAAEDRRQHSADLATALASIPGTELLAGPSEVTVGGLRAQHVAIQVPEDVGCGPYLWYDWDRPSRSPAPGDTIRIWIVDYPHLRMRFWIEAETPRDADPALDQEIQQIIDSIEVIIG